MLTCLVLWHVCLLPRKVSEELKAASLKDEMSDTGVLGLVSGTEREKEVSQNQWSSPVHLKLSSHEKP